MNFLYHYTSIEILALILKNQTIRFTRADKVNDLDEVKISDFPILREAVYISCWTINDSESIPLWNLYGSNLKGVRITFPEDIFQDGEKVYLSQYSNIKINNLMNLRYFAKRDMDYKWIPYIFGPEKIVYEDQISVFVRKDDELMVNKVGTIKNKHWEFEKEYRFFIIPDALWDDHRKIFFINNIKKLKQLDNEYIDIKIKKEVIDNIEITMGPISKDSEYCIVDALLCKYSKFFKIHDSSLKGKIRSK